MVLRLDPAIPLVWRDPHTLQFGVDPVAAVLPEVTPGLERLVALLVAGVSTSGFRMFAGTLDVPDGQVQRLLTLLEPHLVPPPAPEVPTPRALVLGETTLTARLARLLDELDQRTREPAEAALAVLVTDHVVSPADPRRWLQRDVPHLPVVVADASVTVGPYVVPGEGPCLHCDALHHRDADPAWPAIATQLAALPAAPPHPLRLAAATVRAARTVGTALRGELAPGTVLRIENDGEQFSERRVARHPECRCAVPPESDWARADAAAPPRPPSASPGCAAPA